MFHVEPAAPDELEELAGQEAQDEAFEAGAYDEPSCICGDDGKVMHLWPLFSFEELRDPDCPVHTTEGSLG